MNKSKVGVLSCSGEECLGGTISRLATRKVMEELREGKVVSLCLPLYVAGGQEERFFAKAFPVIAVEGCDKCCAKKATEKYSGDVADLVVVSDIIGEEAALDKIVSTRYLSQEHFDMVDKIAEDICQKVDKILLK
ncbi:MAG: putative zinc-binding protein [Sedimentibacter sp.]